MGNNVFNYEGILDRIKKAVEEQLEKAIPEFLDRIKIQLEERYQIAMREFYDVYTPAEYIRRESLFDLLNIQVQSNGKNSNLHISFKEFYADNDGTNLLPIVFMEGCHGGRKPGYTYWGHSPIFVSTPPIELFADGIRKYAIYAAQYDFEAVWSKYAANIKI